MSMGEKLEGQCLSTALQGWVYISYSITCTPEHSIAWAHLPGHNPAPLFRGQTPFFSCCFSDLNVEPMLSGSFREKAGLEIEAKDKQQETI